MACCVPACIVRPWTSPARKGRVAEEGELNHSPAARLQGSLGGGLFGPRYDCELGEERSGFKFLGIGSHPNNKRAVALWETERQRHDVRRVRDETLDSYCEYIRASHVRKRSGHETDVRNAVDLNRLVKDHQTDE